MAGGAEIAAFVETAVDRGMTGIRVGEGPAPARTRIHDVLAAGAFALLRTDLGYRRGSVRLLITSNCMGLLYVVLFLAGMYLGWLDEPFWT